MAWKRDVEEGISARPAGPGRRHLDPAAERCRLKPPSLSALDPAGGSVHRHDPSVA
ncbi:MAG: hypothetical protein ACJ786_41805 [Catenulispora sp.]